MRTRFANPVLLLGLLLCGACTTRADFILTEFMAANATILADEDGAFPDWIEVHNPTGANAGLGGWFLTDDRGDRTKWQFPATDLPAYGYLVVFASGKDRRVGGAPLHTNFRLNADGGYLALVRPDGVIAAEFGPGGTPYPPQSEDISYGPTADTPSEVKYFTTPTPGAENVGAVSNVSVTPRFSVAGGVFTASVTVTLSSPLPGAEIRFTTDGRLPAQISTLYTAPLTFHASTCLRAALFFPGEPPGPSATESYIRLASGTQAFTLPITLNAPTTVFARIRNGTAWSGFTRATFFTPQDLGALRLTELMYHPPDTLVDNTLISGEEFDFLEFKNTGAATQDLSGLAFTSGLTFTFPVGTLLEPGGFFVLARNPALLQAKYPGLAVNGAFTTGLGHHRAVQPGRIARRPGRVVPQRRLHCPEKIPHSPRHTDRPRRLPLV